MIFGRIAGDDGVWRYIFGDHTAGADHGIFSHGNAAEQRGAGTDGGPFLDGCRNADPVIFCLKLTVICRGPGILIIDKRDIVTDKNIVLDGDAFADKGVAGNLAVLADSGIFLYFHESTDFGIVVDIASVKVHEFVYLDVFTELYIQKQFFSFFLYLSPAHFIRIEHTEYTEIFIYSGLAGKIDHCFFVFLCDLCGL